MTAELLSKKNFKKLGLKKKLKAARKEAQLLTECKYYLESNPNEEFIKTQIEYNHKKLNQINDGFDSWKLINNDPLMKQPDQTKLLAMYHSQMERSKVNFQLRVLNFLLE